MKTRSVIISLLLLFIISCQTASKPVPVENSRFILDTLVRVSVYDKKHSNDQIQQAIDRTFILMEQLEAKLSVHVDTSEVMRIIRYAGRNYVNVSEETIEVLKQSAAISEQTRGIFDASIGLLKEHWGFDRTPFQVPDSNEINKLLYHVNYRDVLIEEDAVMLRLSSMRIDLGGIAKGYIIDRSVAFLKNEGMQSGIVEAGGDLRIWGSHPYRERWKIGIRHPRGETNTLIGILQTEENSVATSGDYERFFIKDGKRYHHILDPRTGYPASGCVSVTIVTENAMLADAYATAVFILGPDQGMKFIEDKPEIEGLILFEQNGDIQNKISKGLVDQIQIL